MFESDFFLISSSVLKDNDKSFINRQRHWQLVSALGVSNTVPIPILG